MLYSWREFQTEADEITLKLQPNVGGLASSQKEGVWAKKNVETYSCVINATSSSFSIVQEAVACGEPPQGVEGVARAAKKSLFNNFHHKNIFHMSKSFWKTKLFS